MNYLEHYIEEVKSVKDVTSTVKNYAYYKDKVKPIYEVEMTVNCEGIVSNVTELFSHYEWLTIKQQGFYMG